MNEKIPYFLHKYENILYIIMKYILLDKIRIGDFDNIKKFYNNYFLCLLKKTHPKIWEIKNNNFLFIISNPSLLRSYEYLIKSEQNFQNFVFVFEREIYSFIQIKKGNNDNIQDLLENKISLSVGEFFSDLEDDIVYSSKNNISSKEISKNNFYDAKKDKSSIYNLHKKEYLPKLKRDLTLKETIPLLKNFNPNYTKRANVDKKILRKFKNYLKGILEKKNYSHSTSTSNFGQENLFWFEFVNGNYFPPFKFYDEKEKKQKEFKSFNSNYLIWIFNREKAINFYEEFLKDCGKETLDSLLKEYSLDISEKSKEIEDLQFYLYHLAEVSTMSQERTHTSTEIYSKESNSDLPFKIKESESNESVVQSLLSPDCLNSLNLAISTDPNEANHLDVMSPAPVYPISYEKVYENYLGIGENFELDIKGTQKTDIFNYMKSESNLQRRNMGRIRNNRNSQKKYDSDSDRSLERSRELDYLLFDNLKKYWSDSASDKEE
jgi:hypothetical protein